MRFTVEIDIDDATVAEFGAEEIRQGIEARVSPVALVDPAEIVAEQVTVTQGPSQSQQALDAIHAALDGQEWSSDHLEEVAAAVRDAGYEIRDPYEIEETGQ